MAVSLPTVLPLSVVSLSMLLRCSCHSSVCDVLEVATGRLFTFMPPRLTIRVVFGAAYYLIPLPFLLSFQTRFPTAINIALMGLESMHMR